MTMSSQYPQSSSSMENHGQRQSQNPDSQSWRKPDHIDVEGFLKSFPPGYHFRPRDEELILHYLKPKLFNKPLPPNKIVEVQLYHYNPDNLVEENTSYGEGEWYFFTPRDKKYRNGSRPRRAAGDGYWKATGADRTLRYKEVEIGYRKALVFYRGKPPKGQKTDWMMHEFRLKDPPAVSNASIHDMRLDDWVLCKIYKKIDKSLKNQAQSLGDIPVEEPRNNLPPQVLVPLNNLGRLEEHGTSLNGIPISLKSCHDAVMMEQNSTLFPNNVFHYYDHSMMPMMELSAFPSSIPPLPLMDNLDEFINIHHLEDKPPCN
ncbi:hypothetical protein PTKIN_Ptkin08bG0095300 [Pterospermum kingtungense]